MKKTMIFIIIMATAGVANAAVINMAITSINGEPIDPVNEMVVYPTDVVGLSITFYAPPTEYLYSLGVTVNAGSTSTMDMSSVVAHPDFDPEMEWIDPPVIIECGVLNLGPQGAGEPIEVVWNILIHCDGVDDFYVRLTDDPGQNTIVIDENLDIVPYEYGPGVLIHVDGPWYECWECSGQYHGDATGDGAVTSVDLLDVKSAWQTTSAGSPHGMGNGEYNCRADFNRDGKVTSADLLILRRNWQAQGLGICYDCYCP